MKYLHILLPAVSCMLLFQAAYANNDDSSPASAATAQASAGPPESEKTTAGSPSDQKQSGSGDKDLNKSSQSAGLIPLHHVDFVITGTECPVCIDRMSQKMRKVPGVKKAAIFRFSVTNYGSVIYDAKRVRFSDIVDSVADEHVGFDAVKDTVLSKDEALRLIDAEKEQSKTK
jgi:hypothetical protein